MADRAIFDTRAPRVPKTDTVNLAGGPAYSLDNRAKLAQLACTGTLGDGFYASATAQLDDLLATCGLNSSDPDWIGRTAVYARKHGHMKDAPSVLMAYLATLDTEVFERWAPLVIDNGRMVRNLVQMLRSTRINGQKALPRAVRRYLKGWLNGRGYRALLNESVGTKPSIGDIIKMVHPKAPDEERSAFYSYLIGKAFESDKLPGIVKHLRNFHAGARDVDAETIIDVPKCDFRLLTGVEIKSTSIWSDIALAANWHTLRMNLATFARHGVYRDLAVVKRLAEKLADPETVRKVRVWPTQLWAAYKHLNANSDVPRTLKGALQDALEVSVESVPVLEGGVVMCPDDSGSMRSPITGCRRQQSSSVTCGELAALMSFAVLKRNPDAEILKFSSSLRRWQGNPRDSLVSLTLSYARELHGGGTNLSLPIAYANDQGWKHRTIWYVSDNASWIDSSRWGCGTSTMEQFEIYKKRVPTARMISHNIQPYGNTQATGPNVLNVGGFADTVFQVVADFARDGKGPDVWIKRIESIDPPQ